MRRMVIVVGVLLAALAESAVGQSAVGPTAAEMQSYCRPIVEGERGSNSDGGSTISFKRTFETGICWGAFGALAGVFVSRSTNGQPIVRGWPCLPRPVFSVDLMRVFSAYLDKHLARLGDDFLNVALDSFRETYPQTCN